MDNPGLLLAASLASLGAVAAAVADSHASELCCGTGGKAGARNKY